ncbi:MAG TPA: hypothetical protein VEB65_01065 [Solirubrobacterales bacterium]|nr:hypothetical protein [Solirubrobacterales bacterium]
MPTFSVSCRGDLSGGAIAQLEDAGVYRFAERESGIAGSEGLVRHYLAIDAGSPEDAILVARGALAVAGGEGTDFQVEEAPEPG